MLDAIKRAVTPTSAGTLHIRSTRLAAVAAAVLVLIAPMAKLQAAPVSFTTATVGSVGPTGLNLSILPATYTKGIFLSPVGNGTELPDFGAGPVKSYLETNLGFASGSLVAAGGGACGVSTEQNGCSGGTTTVGHSSLSGNIFALHIGGSNGVFIAVLFPNIVTGFDISYTKLNPGIAGLSSIWAFDAPVGEAPIPAAALLFGSGLTLLGFAGRRKAKQPSDD